MKLAKLSLAAIVAVGAMSTFASASQLEEAIKGVEISGSLRYRFTNNNKIGGKDLHQYRGIVGFNVPVAEGLTANVQLVSKNNGTGNVAYDSDGVVEGKMLTGYFKYANDGFSFQGGRLDIVTPWTDGGPDGNIGDGAVFAYTGVPSWTFALAGFVNTNFGNFTKENLYATGAVGAVGPVNLQLWAAKMTHVFDYSVFADASFKMAGFNVEAQVNHLKLEKGAKATLGAAKEAGTYFGVKAGYEFDGFGAEVGYTQNDEKQPVYSLGNEWAGGFIFFGKQLAGKYVNLADAKTFYGKLDYARANYSVGAGFGKSEAVANWDAKEWYVQAGYKYSKNFKLSTYYSDLSGDVENKRIRFEAKYSF